MGEQQEEKSPLAIFQYQWKLTNVTKKTILSNMLQFCGEKVFRAGLKTGQDTTRTLHFLITDLAKIGFKVDAVFFSTSKDNHARKMKMNLKIGKEKETLGKVQLYSERLSSTIVPTDTISFNFQVYISGVVEMYQYYQKDLLLNEHLWLSSMNHVGTDFEIITVKKTFSVHKFILAARSPVFDAQFIENKLISKQTFQDVDAACMEKFLKFVYTGELEGSVTNSQLQKLSSTYQIKTLESICAQAASQDMDRDQMVKLVLLLNPVAGNCSIEINPDANSEKYNLSSDAALVNFVWKLNQWEDDRSITSARAFEYNKEKVFRAQAKSSRNIILLHPLSYNFVVTLLSFRRHESGNKVQEVSCTLNSESEFWDWKKMDENLTAADDKIFQMFTSSGKARTKHFSPPFSVTFHVKIANTVPNYGFKFVDSTWKEQIWTAAVDKKFTDVEFVVVDQSFTAHRFILSARSPVFAAMFKSGMTEARTGQVHIEDVDPSIFRTFLEFLYVGTLTSFSGKEQLFALADKYQVETLMTLCQPCSEPMDVDDFTKALLAY